MEAYIDVSNSLSFVLNKLVRSILRIVGKGGSRVPNITDIMVRDSNNNDLVEVRVMSNGRIIQSYTAYGLSGNMTIEDYLKNEAEVTKAAILAKGRFAFRDKDLDENLMPVLLSNYADLIATAIEEKKYTDLYRAGGEARKEDIRQHYESIRPTFERIIQQYPKITDYKLAQYLNEEGYKTVNKKPWQSPSAQRLRMYLQNDPNYELTNKSR